MLSDIINAANREIVRGILNFLTQYICYHSFVSDSEILEYVTELMKYPEHIYYDSKDSEGVSAEQVAEKIIAIHNTQRTGDIYIAISDILNYLPEGRFAENIIKRWNVSTIIANRKME